MGGPPDQGSILVLSQHKRPKNIILACKPEMPKPKKCPGPIYEDVPTDKTKHARFATVVFSTAGRPCGRELAPTPGPDAYTINRAASLSTLGIKMSKGDRFREPRVVKKTPDPGEYPLGSTLQLETGVSMLGLPNNPMRGGGNPGPGTYAPVKPGDCLLSCEKRFTTCRFAGGRTEMPIPKIPGPGEYQIPTTVGKNWESQFVTVNGISFTSGGSPGMKKDETPGPNHFGLATQFAKPLGLVR